MIGFSLSQCVGDIARGIIPYKSVEKIFTQARWRDPKQFEDFLSEYRSTKWADCPGKAEGLARELRLEGKLCQPAGAHRFVPKIRNGKHWVDSVDQVTVEPRFTKRKKT